jgi:hypothetical protein
MGQLPPEPGSNATITPGFIVVLDQVTPVLTVLNIQGSLIFDDSRPDLHLILKVRVVCCLCVCEFLSVRMLPLNAGITMELRCVAGIAHSLSLVFF